VQNIKDNDNLTVLLGADIMRQLVDIDCTFDDELVDYYISFLKTLVMRLSKLPHLMMLFYNPTLKVYPLFLQSQQFANHNDQLVRTSVRTIALTLLSMDNEDQRLFQFMPQGQFFINLAMSLRDQWLKIDSLVQKNPNDPLLTRLIEDGVEVLEFIQDVYDVVI
jgi:hypothetical protein